MGRLFARLCSGLVVAALAAFCGTASAQERVVNVYNWTDYIDPAVIEEFQRETGITVRYDVYDSLETLEGKLLAGRSGYDVVVPTSQPTFAKLVAANALAPLDRTRITNWGNLDAGLMHQVESADPGNRFGAIYLWGTVGMGLIPDRVRAQIPDAQLDSLDLLFKPENAQRLAACGISIMDSAIDVVPTVLRYLGKNPDSTSAEDLQAVERTLMAIRPYVRNFQSGGAVEALATGSTCLAFTYSGDVIQAGVRAEEAGRGVTVQYVVGREAGQLWFDMMAVPADAPNRDNAMTFINFMLRPDVMTRVTNAVRYPNAVPASLPGVLPAISGDANIYPSAERQAQFFTIDSISQAAERARTRMWARFKAGQ